MTISPEIDLIVLKFYREATGPFWPPERDIVETECRTIAFPFEEFLPPKFEMAAEWTLDQVLGYLRTWSATQKFIATNGYDPVDSLGVEIRGFWEEGDRLRLVRWPLIVRIGRTFG